MTSVCICVCVRVRRREVLLETEGEHGSTLKIKIASGTQGEEVEKKNESAVM